MQKRTARKGLAVCVLVLAMLGFFTGYSIVGAILVGGFALGLIID
jgi:hypothetical protein